MEYNHPFDFVVDGWRIEFKQAQAKRHAGSNKVRFYWKFNFHRHGKMRADEQCDYYVLCLDGHPIAGQSIYILYSAPIKVKTKKITLYGLVKRECGRVADFEELINGKRGLGPLADASFPERKYYERKRGPMVLPRWLKRGDKIT